MEKQQASLEQLGSELQQCIWQEDTTALLEQIEQLLPEDMAWMLFHWDEATQKQFLLQIRPDKAAEIIQELPAEQATRLIEHLSVPQIAEIVKELHSNQQADLLTHLSRDDQDAVLQRMAPGEAQGIRQLMNYPADTAGGLMITEYLAYSHRLRVGDVLADMRRNGPRYSDYDVQYAYVVSDKGELLGVLRLRDLLLSPQDKELVHLMIKSPLHVRATASLHQLSQFFEQHAFFGAPVTDEIGLLVGIVRRSDVEQAAREKMSRLFLKFSGIMGGEELRNGPLASRAGRRLAVLSVNILLNLLAASVIAAHQDTLSQAIALAVFLPVISDMSGCSGNQAVAVTIRELSLGLVRPHEVLRTLFKEMGVGLFNGLMLGVALGGLAALWQQNLYLGLVVGGALAANTLLSVCLGGIIPLFLKRLKLDPAIASSPILTTFTDICGFLLVFTFASQVLHHLK